MHAAMIGYVQSEDIIFWKLRLDQRVEALVLEAKVGWSGGDKLVTDEHDITMRVASLRSTHVRRVAWHQLPSTIFGPRCDKPTQLQSLPQNAR